jgi:hypothetical protein
MCSTPQKQPAATVARSARSGMAAGALVAAAAPLPLAEGVMPILVEWWNGRRRRVRKRGRAVDMEVRFRVTDGWGEAGHACIRRFLSRSLVGCCGMGPVG